MYVILLRDIQRSFLANESFKPNLGIKNRENQITNFQYDVSGILNHFYIATIILSTVSI